jgi:uncharacterized protein YfaS (alpha-2-macroglobulin family)
MRMGSGLGVLLFGVLLGWSGAVLAEVRGLSHLEAEAKGFVQSLRPAVASAFGPEQGHLLQRLAAVFAAEGDCEAAYALRKKALAISLSANLAATGEADGEVWRALAENAACAGKNAEASWAYWLAQRGLAPPQSASVWRGLGQALEARHSWQQEWKPLAATFYRQALALQEDADTRRRLRRIEGEQSALLFTELTALEQGGGLSLCLGFNQWLSAEKAADIPYRDYVRFSPELSSDPQVRDGKLCAAGARFGTAYEARLLPGLPYGSLRLEQGQSARLEPVARKPKLWFREMAYVLPHGNQGLLPINSVNQPQVELRLYRIHERNILSPFVQDQFRRRLDRDALQQLESQVGALIWQGQQGLDTPSNQVSESPLQLPAEQLAQPGLYLLQALDPALQGQDYWGEGAVSASQWLVVTDIGLTSYLGQGGLWLQARSLSSGKPLANIKLSLKARNNSPLAETLTDEQGMARFDPGLLRGKAGQQAQQVSAYAPQLGFSLLALDRAALDLSDRGVAGRAFPGPLDAYVYIEQGIYRPGAQVNATALLRDAQGAATPPLPLRLRLFNPYGESLLEERLSPSQQGAYLASLNLPSNARTGRWRLALYADAEAAAIGETSFLVEAIAPPRIEARIDATGALLPGQPLSARLQADYLYGVPAAGLRVQAELQLLRESHPFADYADYWFGEDRAGQAGARAGALEQAQQLERIELAETQTDASGQALLALQLKPGLNLPQPLAGRLQVSVIDLDGRTLKRSLPLAVRHLPRYLGIAKDFGGNRAPAHGQARFRLISLDAQGQPLASPALNWRLIAEHSDYQWYQHNGRWNYDRVIYDNPLAEGQTQAAPSGRISLQVAVEQGDYRLELEDPHSGARSSLRFQAGDFVVAESDTPDAVQLSLDKAEYGADEQARLTLSAPFVGEASLVIASDRLHLQRSFSLGQEPLSLDLPLDAAWGAGAYALVSVYRPASAEQQAKRAVGVIWLGLSKQPHALQLELDSPQQVRPRQRIELPVRVKGLKPGEQVELTLAAVDEAVLQLTDFPAPDPLAHFFGKRRLGLELRDLYANLIPRPQSRPGQRREGGDDLGLALEAMPIGNIQVLSRFSGLVRLDEQGQGRVALDLPDFNGRLRLMAVAWSQQRLGSASQTLQVSDPLVVSASLPRFLAIGDQAELSLLLDNLSAPAGEYRISLLGDEIIAPAPDQDQAQDQADLQLHLAQGQRRSLRLPIRAQSLGSGQLQLRLEGPQGYSYQRDLQLGVRGRFFPETRRHHQRLDPGSELLLDGRLLAGLHTTDAGQSLSQSLTLSLSANPAVDVLGLLAELDQYPYGCLEQLISRAYPLLYARQLARDWGYRLDDLLEQRVQAAIYAILEKQASDGGFALWGGGGVQGQASQASELWLSAHALDFLWQAKQTGYQVPQQAFKRGQDWLKQRLGYAGNDAETLAGQAYGHYALALMGVGRAEDLRYLARQRREALPSPLALGQLGAALALMGDPAGGKELMTQAMHRMERQLQGEDYGSLLRDRAALIWLLRQSPLPGLDPARLWAGIGASLGANNGSQWLSTQEQAWLVLAASTLQPDQPLRLQINDRPELRQQGPLSLKLSRAELEQGLRLSNRGDGPLWLALQVRGQPLAQPELANPGFHLQRRWFSPQGEELAQPGQLEQGQELILLLQGEALSGQAHRLLLVDLLPAGLEAEMASLKVGADQGQFPWLPPLSELRYSDALDDRVISALDLRAADSSAKPSRFAVAYRLRAVTPGRYAWPPALVEDMYQPQFRALTPKQVPNQAISVQAR